MDLLLQKKSVLFALIAVLSISPATFSQDITSGLEGYWNFDTFDGGVAVDSSGNGLDALVDSGPPIPAAGRIGNGLFFDGTTDLTVPWKGVLGNAPRSIVLWIRTTETGGLVGWGPNITGEKWHFRINDAAANGVVGALRSEYTGSQTVATTDVMDGQWHMVASVFEGEVPTDVVHYVDGLNDGETFVGNPDLVINTTEGDDVSLGSRIQGANRTFFTGTLDEIRIYSRALSEEDIQALYALAPQELANGMRSFSGDSVVIGESVTVTVEVGAGSSGTLVETIPDGWTASNASDGGVISGNTVTWSLSGGTTSVSYDVSPGEAAIGGQNAFVGELDGLITDGEIQVTLLQGAVGQFDFHADIGGVDVPGSASENGGLYIVEGSGADIWGNADEFHYVFKEMSGPFTIQTTVFADPFDSLSEWVKAGPMVRQNLTPGSRNYMALIRPDFLLNVQWRSEANAASASLPDADRINPGGTLPEGVSFPTGGLELRRLGDVMQTYYEYETEDGGTEWALLDQQEFPFDDPVLVGLAVTSHEDGAISIGEFTNVQITEVNFTAARSIAAQSSGPIGFGETLNVVVDIFQNETGSLNIVETPPAGWAVEAISADAGDATLNADGSIEWTAADFSGIAQLTYQVITPTPTDTPSVQGDFAGTGNGEEIQGDMTIVAKGFLSDEILNAQDITTGLIGHWTMDDNTGTTATDSSSAGRDAVVFAGEPEWVPGVSGSALEFDGDDGLMIPDWYGIGGGAERTVTAWIRSVDVLTHGIVSWGLSGENGRKYHVRVNSDGGNGVLGALRTEIQGSFNIGSTVISDGEWHFIASTLPVEGGVMLDVTHYVDGFLEDEKSSNANGATLVVDTAASIDTSDQEVRIGMRVQGTTDHFYIGVIDEVRIYERALTNAEIQAIMRAEGVNTSVADFMLY